MLLGFDSRRELRALVVRRENSSTGRVFYTAPTSNPIDTYKTKNTTQGGVFVLWCTFRDSNPGPTD